MRARASRRPRWRLSRRRECRVQVRRFLVPDLDRIAELAAANRLAPVWVMPEGTTAEAIIAATRVLADAVAARHWHFTTRLHVLAFADARGR